MTARPSQVERPINPPPSPCAARLTRERDVLRVEGLSVRYHTAGGAVRAADGITFALRPGERLGIAGESGSGKSTMALALLRLIKPPGRIEAGAVWLDGRDLLTLSDEEMRRLRLARIALVPQGSMNSLNPVLRIRDQIADALRDHGVDVHGAGARRRGCAISSRASASTRRSPACSRTS